MGSGEIFVDAMTRATMVPIVIVQRMINQRERSAKRLEGIEQAKREGKYTGRKPIDVDQNILGEVARELDEGIISVKEAMKRTKISSRSTFYRKLRGYKNEGDIYYWNYRRKCQWKIYIFQTVARGLAGMESEGTAHGFVF